MCGSNHGNSTSRKVAYQRKNMASAGVEQLLQFNFEFIDNSFEVLKNRNYADYFTKWDMEGSMCIQSYKFDKKYTAPQRQKFTRDFFKSPTAHEYLKLCTSSQTWSSLPNEITEIEVKKVPCSILSLDFFDRLTGNGIVRKFGSIVKCFEEQERGFVVSDELRKMLLIQDSDCYYIYSESEREEFLFKLFKHLCLGGVLCQYEDDVDPYLNVTKVLYKDMVSVRKDPKTKEIRIISDVFQVICYKDGSPVYPSEALHEQDFSYFSVNPSDGILHILYHKWLGYWI